MQKAVKLVKGVRKRGKEELKACQGCLYNFIKGYNLKIMGESTLADRTVALKFHEHF